MDVCAADSQTDRGHPAGSQTDRGHPALVGGRPLVALVAPYGGRSQRPGRGGTAGAAHRLGQMPGDWLVGGGRGWLRWSSSGGGMVDDGSGAVEAGTEQYSVGSVRRSCTAG